MPNPYNHPTETLNLYMKADTYTFSNASAYGLDTDYNNTAATVTATTTTTNAVITYGFRAYLLTTLADTTELTSGTPAAQIAMSGNSSAQTESNTWNSATTTVTLGSQALKIDVYAKIDSGSWTLQASFLSNALLTKQILSTTWSLNLNLEIISVTGNTTSYFRFGDTTYRSTLTDVTIVTPNYTDIQLWQWMNGDVIGLIFGAYLHVLGPLFYVLIYILIFGGLYFRHRTFNPVAFLLVLGGGAGGFSAWVLLPPYAAAILSVFVIAAIGALLFKVLR